MVCHNFRFFFYISETNKKHIYNFRANILCFKIYVFSGERERKRENSQIKVSGFLLFWNKKRSWYRNPIKITKRRTLFQYYIHNIITPAMRVIRRR